eukprot:10688894-Alexandrium_andersonii.AAC.1
MLRGHPGSCVELQVSCWGAARGLQRELQGSSGEPGGHPACCGELWGAPGGSREVLGSPADIW